MASTIARPNGQLPARPIARERVRARIAEYIKEQILEGQIRVGDRIPQDEVARVLGVSNTPVREALLALEHEGIVTIHHHRGAFVNDFDRRTLEDNYELWGLLYGWAVRRAVARGTPDELRELVARASAVKNADRAEDVHDLMVEYTDALSSVCASTSWRHLLNAIPRLVPGEVFYTFVPGIDKTVERRMGQVATALGKRDGEAAALATEKMLREHGEGLVSELEQRGLFEMINA